MSTLRPWYASAIPRHAAPQSVNSSCWTNGILLPIGGKEVLDGRDDLEEETILDAHDSGSGQPRVEPGDAIGRQVAVYGDRGLGLDGYDRRDVRRKPGT
jgi:hypothetical protein